MPLIPFDGQTFVAFLDISGFKHLMKDDKEAWKVLDTFYNAGYNAIINSQNKVQGLFISDCGILFSNENNSQMEKFIQLLSVIKIINTKMLESNFMLKTSIAFGRFKYQERIEFSGISKDAIYGNAYLNAYLDNENGTPKLDPGLCRIILKDLPSEISQPDAYYSDHSLLKFLKDRKGDKLRKYFYWNVDHPNQIESFENAYKNSYTLKYSGMLKALKNHG